MWKVTLKAFGVLLLAWLLGNFVLGWFQQNTKPQTQHSEQHPSRTSESQDQSCFCHLTGVLDDCFCDVESIDIFNNFKIYPRIRKLTERDYFRYYRGSNFSLEQGPHQAGPRRTRRSRPSPSRPITAQLTLRPRAAHSLPQRLPFPVASPCKQRNIVWETGLVYSHGDPLPTRLHLVNNSGDTTPIAGRGAPALRP